jgi:hypothetical protein
MTLGADDDQTVRDHLGDGELAVRIWRSDGGRQIASVYGTPRGLRWLAGELLALARLDQESLPPSGLPLGEGSHVHVETETGTTSMPDGLVIGRLDAKGSGDTTWFFE